MEDPVFLTDIPQGILKRMTALLEARDLVKHFRKVRAVNGVSFSIAAGRCFGLLGPNGAGKTTTVEMLEGLIKPTSGAAYYRGQPLDARFRNETGIMFQATALQDFMTAREALMMFKQFYPRTLAIDDLVQRCALEEFLDRDTRKISGGQRQRLLLAIALINDPDILFLDEPTTGLDPQARRNFWTLVQEIKAQGKTVVLTTHYMDEAYYLSDEIAIMDRGKIIAQGNPQALLAAHFGEVILQLPRADFTIDATELSLTVNDHDDVVEISASDVNATVQHLMDKGVSLANLRIRARSLEDLFWS